MESQFRRRATDNDNQMDCGSFSGFSVGKADDKNTYAGHPWLADRWYDFRTHALHLMPQSLIDSAWYTAAQDVLSVAVGLMLGTELIADKLKKYGRALHLRLYRGAGSRQIFWRAWRG